MKDASRLPLKLRTNPTREGPLFRKEGKDLILEYDYEKDDGNTEICEIVFTEVLNFEYRQASCLEAFDILCPTEMLCLYQSDRLSFILKLWQKSVGWQEQDLRKLGEERFKHYKMYFDDSGCVDIIASAACFTSPTGP